MNHLIVVAHPKPESFTIALANAYGDELERLGHRSQTRNLYTLGFNPVLAPGEVGGFAADREAPEDIRREQQLLSAAGAVAFFYPLWWASMPAILKGYIDRVLSYGFAYDYKGGNIHGLLAGKKSVIVTVSAEPNKALKKSGEWKAIQTLLDAHIFDTCGIEVSEHLHFGEILPGLSKADADAHIEAVRYAVRKHFGVVPG
jgi:NAD(P)H dehydrogenase (quinone)